LSKKTWLERLDSGQLDAMWGFLQFHKNQKPEVIEIEQLEDMLDKLRVAMVQKSAGQPGRECVISGAVDFDDIQTLINCIVVYSMSIYLEGGFDLLKGALKGDTGGKGQGDQGVLQG
jgi:hypothetical protein